MLYFIIGAVVLAVLLIISLIVIRILRKKREARNRIMDDKNRELNLDRAILNPNANNMQTKSYSQKPYETKYSTNSANETVRGTMVQIEEISEISKRKYMVDVTNPITIGSGTDNAIILTDISVDSKQCEMGILSGMLYIANVGSSQNVDIIRGRKIESVGINKVRLNNKERIRIGNEELIIRLIK